MRNFFFRTCFIALLAIISGNVNSQTSWTASYVQEGNFVLYNVGSGQYFTRGNGWTTQASITESGNQADALRLQLEAVGSNFKIRTDVNGSGCGVEHLSGGTIYTDQSRNKQSTWTFTQVGTDNGPIYTIMSADNHGGGAGKYMSANSSNTIVDSVDDASSDYAKWKLLQVKSDQEIADDAIAAKSATMAALPLATPSNPIDATPVILDANFDIELLQSSWTVETTNSNLQGGSSSNPCAESWRAAFTISQTITGLPEGTYVLKAQAALTDYAGLYNGADYPVVYANEVTTPFIDMEEADRGTSMDKLSGSFTAGKYEVDPLTVFVGEDGVLTVGIKGTRIDTWAIWDNFRLTFYGFDQATLVAAYKNALAEAQGIEGVMSKSAAQELADAISTYNSVDESSNDALSTALNALKTAIANAKHSIEDYKAIANELDNIPNGSCKTTLINKYQQGDFASLDDFYVQLRSVILGGLGNDVSVNITAVILNHTPTANADHWTVKKEDGTVGSVNYFDITYNCAEFWNQSGYSIEQTIPGLPEGSYELYCTAFTRDGMTATLSVSGGASASVNLVTIPSSTANSRYQANAYFNGGGGQNVLTFNIVGTPKDVTIKLKADDTSGDHWTVWRNFNLIFYDNTLLLKEVLQRVVAEAEAVLAAVTGEIPTKALEQFQATINEGKQDYSTPEEYEQVIAKIEQATVNARNLQTVFANVVSRYVSKRNDVQMLMSANKYEQESGAKDAFLSSIDTADEKYGDAESINDVEEAINILQTAILDFIKRIKPFEGNDTEAGEPLDITALLDNPTFEEGGEPLTGVLPGWTCTFVRGETATNIGYQPNAQNGYGITSAENNAYVNGDVRISHFMEAWQNYSSPYVIGDGELYQRLSGLPIGKYRLVNDAIAVNQWYSSWNPIEGVFIYISSGQIETTTEIHTGNGLPEHFEVDFINGHAESLDFGLKTVNTTANWIAADNFRLYYVAALSESPGVAALKEALVQYDGVTFGLCDKTILEAFNNELAHAQEMIVTDIYSSAHSTECIEEINTVQTAYEAVLASVEVYEDYQLAVDEVNERAATTIDAESPLTSDLVALAERLQQNIDAGTAVAEDYNTVDNQINNLENYWSKHFAEEDIQALQVILTKLGDQPAWVNKWNLAAEELTLDGVTNTEGRVTAIQLSNRGLTGTVPAGSLTLMKLTTVNLTGNSFSAVEGVVPDNVSLNIRSQKLDNVIDFKLGTTTAQDVLAQLPSILCYSAGGVTSHFAFSATGDEWGFTLSENNGNLRFTTNSQCIYKEENDAVAACRSSYGDASGSTFNLRIHFDEGDANFNGEVNIGDLQMMINYIFDDLASGIAFNFTAADLFKDNRINVQDVVKEVDVLFAQTDDEAPVKAMYGQQNQKQEDIHASLRFENGNLLLESDIPVTALDITVASDQAISWQALQTMGFTVSIRNVSGGIRIIAYSMSGVEVPVGETAIATTTGSGTVLKATLSDKASNTIGVYLNSTIPTSINDIDETSLEGVSVYDLGGRKVADKAAALRHLPKGIYVINGKKVIK